MSMSCRVGRRGGRRALELAAPSGSPLRALEFAESGGEAVNVGCDGAQALYPGVLMVQLGLHVSKQFRHIVFETRVEVGLAARGEDCNGAQELDVRQDLLSQVDV